MPTIEEQLQQLRQQRQLLDRRIAELEQVKQRRLHIGDKIQRVYAFEDHRPPLRRAA